MSYYDCSSVSIVHRVHRSLMIDYIESILLSSIDYSDQYIDVGYKIVLIVVHNAWVIKVECHQYSAVIKPNWSSSCLVFSIGCCVHLATNLCVSDGVVKGSNGVVVGVLYGPPENKTIRITVGGALATMDITMVDSTNVLVGGTDSIDIEANVVDEVNELIPMITLSNNKHPYYPIYNRIGVVLN